MAYKAKFLHFKTKQSYNTERNKTSEGTDERKVFDAYISFIDEGPTICTWGKEYKCEISKEEIETLIDSKGFITLEDIPNIPIAGTSLPEIAGTAAAGTSEKYAREDHIHPLQTSVTGNAGTATKLQTARNISLTGNVTGSSSFDGSDNISINTTIGSIDASKITSGTLNADRLPDIPLEKLPAGALERLVIVENQAARYQLTTSDVQEGDTVKQNDTGVMYFVVDTDNLANENGYKVYTAGAATKVNNKLTFTGAVTGEYDGSSALTINIPESSGSEIPIALPNPYRLTLGNKFYDGSTAVTVDYLPNQYALTINGSTYNGSSAVTVNTLYPLAEISYATSTTDIGYSTSSGIHAGYVYYPSLWTLSNKNRTIHVKCDKFDFNKPSTIVIIYGEGTVSFEYANGYLLKQNNIITTASSSNSYRLYCFSYLAGKGTNTRVAVNCSEYSI